jgi:hypothetical protein
MNVVHLRQNLKTGKKACIALRCLIMSAAFSATAYMVDCKCVAGTKGIMLASTTLSCRVP